jgi:hypothetical protein
MLRCMTDPLDALIVTDADLARDELASVLTPFVRLTRDGGLVLESDFESLSAERKVLCVLLCVQAMRMLGIRDNAEVTPAEITAISGIPSGTVRPKLSGLLKGRRVIKRGARYELPVHAARRAITDLRSATDA